MRVQFELDAINFEYLQEALEFVETLELVNGKLSTITFIGINGLQTRYNIWHNKKSFTVTSQTWKEFEDD